MTRQNAIRTLIGMIAGIPAAMYGQGSLLEFNFGKQKVKSDQPTFSPSNLIIAADSIMGFEPGTAWIKLRLDSLEFIEISNGAESIRIPREEFWMALK